MSMNKNQEELRTLFIRGLPSDIKERELHNLFRFSDGYEGCTILYSDKRKPVAFSVWRDKRCAELALEKFNEICFDLTSSDSTKLKIQFAKSNSKSYKMKNMDQKAIDNNEEKSSTHSSEYEDIFENHDEGSISSEDSHSKKVSGPGLLFLFNQESQKQKTEIKVDEKPVNVQDMFYSLGITQGNERKHKSPKVGISPCTTLFVSNLSKETTFDDLLSVFSQLQGYERLKMMTGNDGHPISFVEFSSIYHSTQAKDMIQGFKLNGLNMRIQFAKKQMNPKRNRIVNQENLLFAKPYNHDRDTFPLDTVYNEFEEDIRNNVYNHLEDGGDFESLEQTLH